MKAKTAALLFGIVFIAVGLLGYISNPIIGESADAIFHADSTHSIVHIASGVFFLLIAFAMPQQAKGFLVIFGIVYLAIGVIGLVNIGSTGMVSLFGFLHVNEADNYLHIGLGLVILLAGIFLSRSGVTSTA
jgi:hypothetical protein